MQLAKVAKTKHKIFQGRLAKQKLFVYLRPDFRNLFRFIQKYFHNEKNISAVKAEKKKQTWL
jgi:hypothetical protein